MVIFFDYSMASQSLPCLEEIGNTACGRIAGDDLDALCSEEEAYEYFCDVGDKFIGIPITAIARFEADSNERAALFRTRVRAIYRASVWGQFSLLCAGISTPHELKECCGILNEAFCELAGEGREFNGFIEKGIVIDTPMMLYNLPRHSGFDFSCFDIEKLRQLCTGAEHGDRGWRELADHIEQICLGNDKREIAIKSPSLEYAQKAEKSLDGLRIIKIFL